MFKRFKNIFFVIIVIFSIPFRVRVRKKIDFKKFLIIYPTNNIGDMTCATPLFSAIKRQVPNAHITVISSSINKSLLAHHPYIDECMLATQSSWSLIRKLRTGNYDAGIVINPDALSVAILFLGNVHTISALTLVEEYVHTLARPFRIMSKLVLTTSHTPGTYIPQSLLRLLTPFGIISTDTQKLLGYTQTSHVEAMDMLRNTHISITRGIVAVAPGAGSDIKRWPVERFAHVTEYLQRQHAMPIIIIGGPNDTKAVSEFLHALSPSVHYFNPGPLSMEHLKAFLGYATLLIGNDSGAVHVAQAVGTKTIAIVGATDDGEHLLATTYHKVIRASADKDGVYRSYVGDESKMDRAHARAQMEAVTVKKVIDAINDTIFSSQK